MIPVADWSRARRAPAPEPVAAEPVPLAKGESVEPTTDGSEAYDELVLALVLASQENARLEEIGALRRAVQADLSALGERLSKKIVDVAAAESRSMTEWAKSLLRPWIGGRIEEAAIASFVDEVSLSFRRKLIASVTVSSPESMKVELQAQFAKLGLEVAVQDSPDNELHATQGGTEVMTRISQWQQKLDNLLT